MGNKSQQRVAQGTQAAICATAGRVVEKIRGCVPVSPRGQPPAAVFAQVAHTSVPARGHTSRKSRHFSAKMAQKSTRVPVGFVAFLRKKVAARFAAFRCGNPELCVNEALEDATPDVGRIKALYYSFV